MRKTPEHLTKKCRQLRRQGKTLEEIMRATGLPKTTVYDHICDISLPASTEKRLANEARKRLDKYRPRRKGKALVPIKKPKRWTPELIEFIAHISFDGQITSGGCYYTNNSMFLLNRMREIVHNLFELKGEIKVRPERVPELSCHNVELANYVKGKKQELFKYIPQAELKEKRLFLRVFFDDEGCMDYNPRENNRRVRGFQHSKEILELVQGLLRVFDIQSSIDHRYTEIQIYGRQNLIKFRDEINFSEGVAVNGKRKNSIWKEDLEKREILNQAISSYKSVGTPGVHRTSQA